MPGSRVRVPPFPFRISILRVPLSRCTIWYALFMLREGPQVLDREVPVALHHFIGLPASELLQDVRRRAALDVPTRPGVAEVVPAKPGDAGAACGRLEDRAIGIRQRSLA